MIKHKVGHKSDSAGDRLSAAIDRRKEKLGLNPQSIDPNAGNPQGIVDGSGMLPKGKVHGK